MTPFGDAGRDVAEEITSNRDLAGVQARLKAWAAKTGPRRPHLSLNCALSIGENQDLQTRRAADN